MKKSRILILSALIVVLVSVCVVVISAGAGTSANDPVIGYCNLSFRDNVCIKYAVKSNNSDVKLLIWTEPEKTYTVGTEDDEITSYYTDTIDGSEYKVFDYTKLFAKQMTDVIYARAYVNIDGVDYYSSVNKYSILQYAYNMLGKTAAGTNDAELREMLENMLLYGASAQKYLDDYKVDRLATDDWYQVKLTSGTLDDGCANGLYLPGDVVTVTAPEKNSDGASFSYWADSKNNKVSSAPVFELTVGNKNEVYTPIYVEYSAGLEFDSNGDKTCYVVGIGDCEDTAIVIPPVSDTGDVVIGIDNSAFAGEAITSVSFPSTLEEIGRKAFSGCDQLTDVYFDGTEAEWGEINISSGNDPIENATKHFNEPIVETFTVTFVDYDGSVIKTEEVELGSSATAPEDPSREGYTFIGWDADCTNVTADLEVGAIYEIYYSGATIVVSDANVAAGAENVEITVALKNNPGITSMFLKIAFDNTALELVSMTYNTEIGGTGIPNASNESPVTAYWAEGFNNVEGDWVFVTLTFNVSSTAMKGEYDITVTYEPDDIFDANETNVEFDVKNGKITVS